jgi:histidine triad (HIT) family protein
VREGCPFCDYDGPSPIIYDWPELRVFGFAPLNPVVPGHVLIVPRAHVEHLGSDPALSAVVMRCAARVVAGTRRSPGKAPCNVIASVGAPATQTVMHLHVHVVPRRVGDGLKLPWSA